MNKYQDWVIRRIANLSRSTIGLFICVLILLACYIYKSYHSRIPKGRRSLPGPRGFPLIGSIPHLGKYVALTFHDWSKTYGPIYKVNLAGEDHIIITDEQIAHEILNKRAPMYADRPHARGILPDNRASGHYVPLLNATETWKRQRKFVTSVLRTARDHSFYGYQELEVPRLLMELLVNPTQYRIHTDIYACRIASRLAWGTAVGSHELYQRMWDLLYAVSPTGTIGNRLTFLMDLPSWLSSARSWELKRIRRERMFYETMQDSVKMTIASGKEAAQSWTKSFLEAKPKHGITSDLEGAYIAGMSAIPNTHLTGAFIQNWCLALVKHPHVLKRIQQEVDAICRDHPPTLAEMPRLPYLRSTICETMRWRPHVPTGIPHCVREDDVYNGYFIRKGTIIHANEWSFSRNPQKYPQPEAFIPERWLDASYPTCKFPLTQYPTIKESSQFGWGYRRCPGAEAAEAHVFVAVAGIAWAFNVAKAFDASTGVQVEVPDYEVCDLLIAGPEWFQFDMKVRDEKKRDWIETEYQLRMDQRIFEPAVSLGDEIGVFHKQVK